MLAQTAQDARTGPRLAKAPAPRLSAAIPLAPKPAKPEEPIEAVEAAKDAAERCSCVVAGFFRVDPAALFKSTRGLAREAFPRQVLMAGLVSELGFSSKTAGKAVGRDKATVEHACRIIEGLRGGLSVDDLIEGRGNPKAVMSEADVLEFFGGEDDLVEFLEYAEGIIDGLFAAFVVCAVQGGAYSRAEAKMRAERIEESQR